VAALTTALLDTSTFIAQESSRRLDIDRLPPQAAVSAVTIGELRWGVLMAEDDTVRSRRLQTLTAALRLEPVPVDDSVAASWALLRRLLKTAGVRMEVNDSWIAATALAHGWPVATQDAGFPDGIGDLQVLRV
jgi:predicted nucleic acid-binding protein